MTLFVVVKSPHCCNRISGRGLGWRIEKRIKKTRVYLSEGTVLYFGLLQNHSIGHSINRLSYSCGVLIAFFQIFWAIIR